MTVCYVIGCKSGSITLRKESKTSSIQTFPLPNDPKMKRKWYNALNRNLDFSAAPRVCARHFESRCFIPDGLNIDKQGRPRKKKKLQPWAEPTLFLKQSKQKKQMVDGPLIGGKAMRTNLSCPVCHMTNFGNPTFLEKHIATKHGIQCSRIKLDKVEEECLDSDPLEVKTEPLVSVVLKTEQNC